MSKSFFMFDAMSLAYRAYYAFISNPLINSKGQNVSSLYGFFSSLLNIRDTYKPDYIAIVFDRPEPTFRHKIFPQYKATRLKMPDDMAEMMSHLKDLVRAMNLPLVELAGFEADDIIGTLAKKFASKDLQAHLVTVDKDYMQLVSECINLFKSSRDGYEIIGIENVKEKFGVSPDKVIEVLGLMGDSSDNIPGVPGIGEKTAIPLIQKYGSIENIYKNINEIPKEGVKNKLIENKKLAELSRHLVTIDINVPIKFELDDFKTKQMQAEPLVSLLKEYELNSIAKRIAKYFGEEIISTSTKIETSKIEIKKEEVVQNKIQTIETSKHNYHLIKTNKDLKELIDNLKKQKEIVFDTETTSTNPLECELVGISFCYKKGEAFYIPISQTKIETNDLFGDNSKSTTIGFEEDKILKDLKFIFETTSIKKIGQNIKYDSLVLSIRGVKVNNISFDTLVVAYLIRNDGEHSLDALALKYLNYKTISFKELLGDRNNTILDVPIEKISDYSCEDSDITFQLFKIFEKEINKTEIENLSYNCEIPLISVLISMESQGVKIDVPFLSKMEKTIDKQLSKISKNIIDEAGEDFNINSTQQLGKILFEKLKLPIVKKTKTGYSTDISVLEELNGKHKIINHLLEYRTLNKINSTYVKALPQLINPKTGRVHTSFNQTVASTGRLSSSNPNFQNIPIRTEIGREIRRAFIPSEKENKIISADYSQIELRVFAHMSGDIAMIEAFQNREDIHSTTAQKVFGVKKDEVSKEMRRKAKEVNFGLIYGIGVFGLARNLEVTHNESKEIISKYFERFPNVKKYMDATLEFARENGFVQTLYHRKRFLPDIKNSNRMIRQNAERQAINMPIQGTSADMIKLAMISIQDEIIKRKLKSKMILQVHDELVFDVPKNEVEEMKILIATKMQTALILKVPIEIEIGVGDNWLEAHN